MEREIEIYAPLSIQGAPAILSDILRLREKIKKHWNIFMLLFEVRTKAEANEVIKLLADQELDNTKQQRLLVKCRPALVVYMQQHLTQDKLFFVDVIDETDFQPFEQVNHNQVFTIDFWLGDDTYEQLFRFYEKQYHKGTELNVNLKLHKPMTDENIAAMVQLLTPYIKKHYRYIPEIKHTRADTPVMNVKGLRNYEMFIRKYVTNSNQLCIELTAPNTWQLATNNEIYSFKTLHKWSNTAVLDLLIADGEESEDTYFYGSCDDCSKCICDCAAGRPEVQNRKSFAPSQLYCAEMRYAKQIDDILKASPPLILERDKKAFIHQI